METFHLRVFQGHVLDQCRFLLAAANEINAGLASRNTDQILYAIQNLLNAAANISKMLWGQKGKLVDREEPRRRGNSHGVGVRSVGERHDAGTQKLCQPAEQQAEVVAGGGKDGVDAVALGSLEIVAAQAVLGLEMADNWLYGSAAPHLAADRGGDPADLAGDPDPEPVRVIVAAIPLVDVDAAVLDV